ncbi:MAG: hypothetical protein EZS28_026132 [Streblomastix strix]|uniref:Uncharacterized protein n=1 Tax=Streblomastix strix TaxID=222440 RepID=A0A5J4V7B3_9EUKA|nr:MAG: hypothetical protein EZS28_026132 [Streblomastix strix]
MMENDTNAEYFDGGYFIRDKKQIKCFENGKRGLKVVTQAQQNKLMMQAKGKPEQQFGYKKQSAKMFESDSDESQSDNSMSSSNRNKQYHYANNDNSVGANEEEQPKPAKQVKRKIHVKISPPKFGRVDIHVKISSLLSQRFGYICVGFIITASLLIFVED